MDLNEKELKALLLIIDNAYTASNLDSYNHLSLKFKGVYDIVHKLILHEQISTNEIAGVYEKLAMEYLSQIQQEEIEILSYEEEIIRNAKIEIKTEIAKKLLQHGTPIEKVISYTCLSEVLVLKLIEIG